MERPIRGKMSKRSSVCKVRERRTVLRALSVLPLATACFATEPDLFHPIREEIAKAILSGKATGVAVAVVHRGRIIWEEGFGWANREAGLRATPHTPFSLASISKPFTTTLLTVLAADGRLSLDEAANAYLGDLSLRGVGADNVTIRELGAHASGLPSLFEMYPTDGSLSPPTPDAILRAYGTLAYPAGQIYEYSNIGYAAIGVIASRLTKMDFGRLITSRLLMPLGLRDSFFATDASHLKRAAARYDEMEQSIPYYTTATPPSGELYASAHDLAQFALFNLKGHTIAGRPVLDEHWLDELHKPVLRGPAAGATTFGWFSGRGAAGIPVLFKDGGQPGVSTVLYLVPSESLACLVLTNRSDNGDLAQILVDRMIAAVIPSWTTPDTRMDPPGTPFVPTSDYLGQWTGRLSGGGADMRVRLNLDAESSTLSLDEAPAQAVTDLQLAGSALTGKTIGRINAPDAIRAAATLLRFKLLRETRSLDGRLLASASGPGRLATIPFVIRLARTP